MLYDCHIVLFQDFEFLMTENDEGWIGILLPLFRRVFVTHQSSPPDSSLDTLVVFVLVS